MNKKLGRNLSGRVFASSRLIEMNIEICCEKKSAVFYFKESVFIPFSVVFISSSSELCLAVKTFFFVNFYKKHSIKNGYQ